MSVVKKSWDNLLTENEKISAIVSSEVLAVAQDVDTAFNTKYGRSTLVKRALEEISQDYLKTVANGGNGLWEDLPIYMSSYKVKDRKICTQIEDNLIRYLRFIQKMVTDEGLTRKMIVNRNFNNTNTSQNTDKNVFSETPQIELQDFEEAIAYASNVSRNENTGGSTQSGLSGETATNVNWEEQLKNIQFAFYNELVEYIVSIPSELYNYYCLDSRPITELVKARREALYNLYRL